MIAAITKRFSIPTLIFLCLFSVVGCQSILNKAKDVATEAAINVADRKMNQFYDSTIMPKIVALEEKIGKLDQNGDGEFSSEELTGAIIRQVKADIARDGIGGIDWTTLMTLIGMWLTQKFGLKFGPKGFKGFRNWKSKRGSEPEVDLG